MLKLNKANGEVEIGDIQISPQFSVSRLDDLNKSHEIIKTIVNEGYVSYSIPNADEGEFSLYVIFYLNKLSSLSLTLGRNYNFPPWQITNEEIFQLNEKLKSIGGEANYDWGSITLSEDRKGGIVSIVIKYK